MSSRSRPRARSQGDHPRRPLSPEIRVLQDKPVSKLIHRTESRTGSRDRSADDQSTSHPTPILKKALYRDSSPGTTYEQVASSIKVNTDLGEIIKDCEGVDEYTDRRTIVMSVLKSYYDTMDPTMTPKFKGEVARLVVNRAIREIEAILRTFAHVPGKQREYEQYQRIHAVMEQEREVYNSPKMRYHEEKREVENVAEALGRGLAKTLNITKIDVPEFAINSDLLERTREFKLWCDTFKLKMEALNITDPESKYRVLRASLGAPAVRYMESYPDVTDKGDRFENYMSKAANVFIMKNPEIEARTRFRTIKQRSGEELSSYINRIRENSDLCGWTHKEREQQTLEQLTSGTLDEEWRKRIMMKSMSLHEAISWAQTLTSVRATNQAIKGHNGGQEAAVHWNNRTERPMQPEYRREPSADRFQQSRGYRRESRDVNERYDQYRQSDRRDPSAERYQPNQRRDSRARHQDRYQGYRQDDQYRGSNTERYQQNQRQDSRCIFCELLHAGGRCNASRETCRVCGEVGHYGRSRICKGPRSGQQNFTTRNNQVLNGGRPYERPPTPPNNGRIQYTQRNPHQFDHSDSEITPSPTADSAVHAVLRQPPPQSPLF